MISCIYFGLPWKGVHLFFCFFSSVFCLCLHVATEGVLFLWSIFHQNYRKMVCDTGSLWNYLCSAEHLASSPLAVRSSQVSELLVSVCALIVFCLFFFLESVCYVENNTFLSYFLYVAKIICHLIVIWISSLEIWFI